MRLLFLNRRKSGTRRPCSYVMELLVEPSCSAILLFLGSGGRLNMGEILGFSFNEVFGLKIIQLKMRSMDTF